MKDRIEPFDVIQSDFTPFNLDECTDVSPKETKDILQGLMIDPLEELQPPKVAWVQHGEDHDKILGTLGNFSLIIGKAKSKKSFFINIAISAVLNNDKLLNQFKGTLTPDKCKVLYFDTEQGKYHVQLAVKRICRQIGIPNPENLHTYHLRSKSPAERLELIEYAIYNTPDIGFVVIDGIKDLVNSINDEIEATMIASKLLKWTEEQNIHIVTVLHQNKGDNNARGHLGTELINKSEIVLSVTKSENDNTISVVKPELCRNKEPDPFAFEINDEGLPVLVADYVERELTVSKKITVEDLAEFQKYQLLTSVFSVSESFGYGELVEQIKRAFKVKYGKNLGTNKAKEFVTYAKSLNWIVQNEPKQPYELGNYNEGI